MVIKIYIASSTGSIAIKKHQQDVVGFLEANRINFKEVDITMLEDERLWMYNNIPKDRQPDKGRPVPPQIFNDDHYCGLYEIKRYMFGQAPDMRQSDCLLHCNPDVIQFHERTHNLLCQLSLSLAKDYEDFFLSKENNTVFTFLGLKPQPSIKS